MKPTTLSKVKKTLDTLYRLKSITWRGYKHQLFPTSITYTQGRFLLRMVEFFQPSRVIEVGLGYGLASLWMHNGNSLIKEHIVFDMPDTHYSEIGRHIIKTAGLNKKITAVSKESQIGLAELLQTQTHRFDMAILDGDERFDGFVTDMYFLTKIIKVGGVIVARNAWNPSVRRALIFAIRNLPYEMYGCSTWEQHILRRAHPRIAELLLYMISRQRQSLFCVLQKTEKDDRPWNHYVEF